MPPLHGWAEPGQSLPRFHPGLGVPDDLDKDDDPLVALRIPKDLPDDVNPWLGATRASLAGVSEETMRDYLEGDEQAKTRAKAELAEVLAPPEREHASLYVDERHQRIAALPSELFMREFLDVDAEDIESCVDFWSAWGPLLIPPALLEQREVARTVPVPRQWPFSKALQLDPLAGELVSGTLSAAHHRDAIYDELRDLLSEVEYSEGDEMIVQHARIGGSGVVTRSMTGYSVSIQLCLIALYQAVFESLVLLGPSDLAADAFDQELRAPLSDVWERRGVVVPGHNWELLDTVLDAVNSGASVMGPRLELSHPQLESHGVAYFRPIPRILPAMCLQAIAFIADGAPARRCANENCGQWFTRQRGRSKAGQTRATGVLYCSASCAKASAQRAYRRRQRDALT